MLSFSLLSWRIWLRILPSCRRCSSSSRSNDSTIKTLGRVEDRDIETPYRCVDNRGDVPFKLLLNHEGLHAPNEVAPVPDDAFHLPPRVTQLYQQTLRLFIRTLDPQIGINSIAL